MAAEFDEWRVRPVLLVPLRHFLVVPGAPYAFAVGNEVVVGVGADLAGETRRPRADEEDMRQLLHHRAGHHDRMAEALERADRADAQRRAVHHRGVELDLTEQVGPAAASHRAHRLVALDQADAGLDRRQGGAAFGEQLCGRRGARPPFVVGDDDHYLPSARPARRRAARPTGTGRPDGRPRIGRSRGQCRNARAAPCSPRRSTRRRSSRSSG